MIYVAPNPLETKEHFRIRLPHLGVATALGVLALGVGAETVSESPPDSLNLPALEAIQSAGAQGTPQKVFDRIVQADAEDSATATGTPWPVASTPTIPKVVINYTSKPDGYSLGNLIDGDTAGVSGINRTIIVTRGRHHFAENWSLIMSLHANEPTDKDCGWVRTFQLARKHTRGLIHTSSMPDVCKERIEPLADRNTFGIDFNGPPHRYIGGTFFTRRKIECQYNPLALNRDEHIEVPIFYDPVPPQKLPGGINYRFTSRDHQAATASAKLKVDNATTPGWHHFDMWGFDDRDCVIGPLKGGPLKPGL